MTDDLARRRGLPTIAITAGSARVVRVVRDRRLFAPQLHLGRAALIEILARRRRAQLRVINGKDAGG